MESNKDLKVGMKVKLKPYSDDLVSNRLNPGHPGMPSDMQVSGVLDTVVTVSVLSSSANMWFRIKEDDGRWLWDVRWIAEEVVEEVDCDDCKHNPNAIAMSDIPPKCWDCINAKGVKRLFEPKDDTCQLKGKTADMMVVDDLPIDKAPTTALAVQVGGSHYKDMKIQPIEFAIANKLNSCQTLALRYLTRKKGGKEKVLEDRRKAIHVIEMEIEMITNGDIEVD